ncbi:MAG: hypothetical protein WKF58_13965 [Ilumatobacteraceae bacterium]
MRDDRADTIDVLPSLVDLLDVSLASADEEWTFDGHSLYDGSEPTSQRVVTSDVAALDALAQRQSARFPRGDDWLGLAAVGRHGKLVGEHVAGFPAGAPSELTATWDDRMQFDDLTVANQPGPPVVAGTVSGADGARPSSDLLVAINGRVAGVAGGYRSVRRWWRPVLRRLRRGSLPRRRQRRPALRGRATGTFGRAAPRADLIEQRESAVASDNGVDVYPDPPPCDRRRHRRRRRHHRRCDHRRRPRPRARRWRTQSMPPMSST